MNPPNELATMEIFSHIRIGLSVHSRTLAVSDSGGVLGLPRGQRKEKGEVNSKSVPNQIMSQVQRGQREKKSLLNPKGVPYPTMS
jgi:hypothetical protein